MDKKGKVIEKQQKAPPLLCLQEITIKRRQVLIPENNLYAENRIKIPIRLKILKYSKRVKKYYF